MARKKNKPDAPIEDTSQVAPEKKSDIAETGEEKKDQTPPEKPPEGQMFIKVYSPFKIYFEGLGTSISAANDTGAFDILTGHHRFLTLLSACEVQIRTNEGDSEAIKIDRGIMYVKADRVTVFLDV
jgi:hypothetical protein